MESVSFKKKLLKLFIPLTIEQLLLALVGASDAIMLGGLSQAALSSVSLATQVTFVFNIFMSGIITGENMNLSQFFGSKDIGMVKRTIGLILRFVLILSIVIGLLAIIIPKNLMQIFTNDLELIDLGAVYLKYVGLSYIFSGVLQVLQTLLKNAGFAKFAMSISAAIVFINIELNAIFIYGLFGVKEFGISGAALATTISQIIGFTICFIVLIIKARKYISVKEIFIFDKKFEKVFWKREAQLLFNICAWGIGFTTYSVILGHMGSDAVAANSLANITKNLLLCACYGVSSAGAIIIGNELGSSDFEVAKKDGKKLLYISIIAGIATGLVLISTIPIVVRIGNLTPTAKSYLVGMMLISSYYIAGKSINCMTIPGIYAVGGDTKFGMICDTSTLWLFSVPFGALAAFVFHWPVMIVYLILNTDEVVKLPVVIRRFFKYKWVRNITTEVKE